jgi:general secretion pathway protein D
MKEFITFVADFSGVNIVYNESDLRGNVSIVSQYPMNAADIITIFHSTLNNNGLSAVREGNFMRIVPDRDMPRIGHTVTQQVHTDGFSTMILILNSYNATTLANFLGRIRSQHGSVEPLRGINGLLIRDFGNRIEQMRELAYQMDNFAAEYRLHTITVQNTTATRMEQHIMKLFNELTRNHFGVVMPTIISDDLSNVLVIAATDNDFQKIQYLISQIDIKNTSEANLPRIFYLKNTSAEDVEKVLNKLLVGGPGQPGQPAQPGGRPVAAARSSVSSDKATNSIIAIGDQEFYANLEALIEKLDIPRKQVYVEALILETSLDRQDSYGVQWFGAMASGNSMGAVDFGGSLGSVMNAGGAMLSGIPGGFSAGIIGDVITYNGMTFPSIGAFMSAIRMDAGVNIVSNPQILTLDNEEAEVFVGENMAFVTGERTDVNSNTIQTFDYRNVGVRLKITPQISGDDMVNVTVDLEVNKVSGGGATTPTTLTRTTKTKVQLYDRSIMVVSGLMKDDSAVATSGIPLLSQIPILGWLFKSTYIRSEKTNMMVFLTAHIINTHNDVDRIMQRRTQSTSLFNERVNNMIWDNLSEDPSRSFIPMRKEADMNMHGIGTE